MSDGDLRPGDGLLLRGFSEHPTPTVKLNYGAPKQKGSYHLMMWLGIWSDGAAGADERLNLLGWVFDPKLAAQAIEARRAETGTGSVHESAVGSADAANPLRNPPDKTPLVREVLE